MSPESLDSREREFVISRHFAAPRERVFRAWVEPAQLTQWWGPYGFSNPVCELDVRPGGAYRIVMRGPDGVDYPLKGVYREVVPPARLVMTDDCSEHPEAWHAQLDPGRRPGEPRPALDALSTVTFNEEADGTRLEIRTQFASAAILDAMLRMGMTGGWTQSLERLERHLMGH